MKIYTKTGDSGETSLFNGTRVKKNNVRIVTYGIVDEVNSHIGLLQYYVKLDGNLNKIYDILYKVQNQLFTLGSDLANPNDTLKDYPRITDQDVSYLENEIDNLDRSLDALKSFILPGGSLESSYCHVIRTIIRRAEVNITVLVLNDNINKNCLVYLNRLSDLFFVLSRFINKIKGVQDIPWKS